MTVPSSATWEVVGVSTAADEVTTGVLATGCVVGLPAQATTVSTAKSSGAKRTGFMATGFLEGPKRAESLGTVLTRDFGRVLPLEYPPWDSDKRALLNGPGQKPAW